MVSEPREVSWSDFCRWVSGKTVAHELDGGGYGGEVVVVFSDGSSALFESRYYAYESDSGAEPPRVKVADAP